MMTAHSVNSVYTGKVHMICGVQTVMMMRFYFRPVVFKPHTYNQVGKIREENGLAVLNDWNL